MPSSSLRILHIRTVRGTGGGPDKTIFRSCRYCADQGNVAEAFYMLDRRSDTAHLPAAARDLGICLHPALEGGPLSLATLRTLSHVLATGQFDVVHTHDYKSSILAPFFRRRHGFKLVATVHGYNRTTRREALYYALERRFLRLADAIVTPTRQMYQWLMEKGLAPDRVHVIPNGIEVEARPLTRPARNGRIHLLYLGRLSREKDPINLVRALAQLRDRNVKTHLTLAGDGPEFEALAREVRDLRLTDCVAMPGYVTDVTPFLARADILVNPSRTECMPNAILEAMAAGVPVVATDVGGVGELIRPGVDGLLCSANNPDALARSIGQVLGDPALAQRLADSAYRRVTTEFSFEAHMRATLDLYRRLLDQG